MVVNRNRTLNAFQKTGILTIVAVYLLILAGGIVRSTGSGMGCPDWPKCFGSWVPPTEVSQLPPDYREAYAEKRKLKNEKLAQYLAFFGWDELSGKIHNESIEYVEAEFNAAKTWIEYINRLLGALTGILIFLTVVFALPLYKQDKALLYLSVLTLCIVGFQGWLGSIVVSTDLLPGMVTVHMLPAILIVFLLVYTVMRSLSAEYTVEEVHQIAKINPVLIILLVLSMVQIILGTQVREAIDSIAAALGSSQRSNWVSQLGTNFYIHRSFSALILLLHGYLFYQLYKEPSIRRRGIVFYTGGGLLAIVVLEILAGVVLSYLNFPAFAQPIHLVLAIVAVGIQFTLLLLLNYRSLFFPQVVKQPGKKLSYQ